jgi:hypothetical protein
MPNHVLELEIKIFRNYLPRDSKVTRPILRKKQRSNIWGEGVKLATYLRQYGVFISHESVWTVTPEREYWSEHVLHCKSKGSNQLFHFPKEPFIPDIQHKLLDENGWPTASGINGVLNLTTCDLSKGILWCQIYNNGLNTCTSLLP